jgi:hypothetical protein
VVVQLDTSGNLDTLWTQVPAVNGINVIYNNTDQRNLYSVASRANDQIDLVFGDGSFTNIPVGNFRVYYRLVTILHIKLPLTKCQVSQLFCLIEAELAEQKH